MSNLSPANEARLRAAITERGLQAAEELIVASSAECAVLCTLGEEDYAQIGTSRYGGVPDLPDESWWPRTSEGKFYQFVMQVNLADVPDFAGNMLPRSGMLYAFLADYDNIAKDWAIQWADVPTADLHRMEPKKVEDIAGWYENERSAFPACRLVAQAGVDVPRWYSATYDGIERSVLDNVDELEDEDETFDWFEGTYRELSDAMRNGSATQNYMATLMGHPFYIGHDPHEDGKDYGMTPPANYVLLLTMFSDRAGNVNFGDAGYVQLFIDPTALTTHDFSWVFARMESS